MIESPPLAHASETAELFGQYGAGLYRFARVLLHQPADAEDVVQTAFVKLIEHLGRGGRRDNLRAWLFTVTANLARDRLRGRHRWLPWDATAEADLMSDPVLDSRDAGEQFLAAARQLAPRDRLLLALKAQGLSYREIAEVAGIREVSVGQLLARAVARWRRAHEATSIS